MWNSLKGENYIYGLESFESKSNLYFKIKPFFDYVNYTKKMTELGFGENKLAVFENICMKAESNEIHHE